MSHIPAPPAELNRFVSVIGAEATLGMLEAFPGQRVHVPKTINQGSPLAAVIGLDAARQLAEAFGGEVIKVPSCKYWRCQVYAARGMTRRAIGQKLGWDEATVYKHLARARRPDPQMSLGF